MTGSSPSVSLIVLDPEELSIVAGYMNLVEVKAGDLVFREGREGNYVCFVAEGELEVVKKNAAGKEVVLTTLKRGASIGEMAILDEQPRSAHGHGEGQLDSDHFVKKFLSKTAERSPQNRA